MKKIILVTLILVFSFAMKAQTRDLPKKPKNGKCYERKFSLDKKYGWKEIDCKKNKKSEAKLPKDKVPTEEDITKAKEFYNKIKEYQTKLINEGYEVEINGIFDDTTINAHHKYLKQRKKIERKKRRAKKKKLNQNKV
ncbi:hypothetical protein [Winogradskyella sp. PE311]|uniref:hypothetical protein n=1 Tax=Winogradskyella sp. PE311 TaxID=3366943 RepID=UPI00397F5DA0